MKHLFLILFISTICLFFFLYKWFPFIRVNLIEEDMLIENLTVILLFVVSLFSLFCLLRVKGKSGRKIFILTLIVGFLGFLDELSFGERIFHFKMPIVAGTKVDSIHDFLKLGYSIISSRSKLFILVFGLALGALLAIIWIKYMAKVSRKITILAKSEPYFFLFVCIGLVLFSLMVDFYEVSSLLEELLEMNAALVLGFSCFSAFRRLKHADFAL